METICVFLGSSVGNRKIYSDTAKDLATSIIDHGYKIVFGGGNNGLMGILADAAIAADGHITGIITEQLNEIEVGHKGLSELVIVQSSNGIQKVGIHALEIQLGNLFTVQLQKMPLLFLDIE